MGTVEKLKLVTAEPRRDVIERLQALLEKAQAGDLRDIAYCYVHTDGTVPLGWTGGGEGNRYAMVAAIALLQHDYLSEWRKQTLEESGLGSEV